MTRGRLSTTTELTETAFVAEAERMTNERDVDGIRQVFAADGHQVATLDGLLVEARGIEVWQLDGAGMVVDQRLYGFLDARPESSPVQSLRKLVAHPLTAIAFARAKSRG